MCAVNNIASLVRSHGFFFGIVLVVVGNHVNQVDEDPIRLVISSVAYVMSSPRLLQCCQILETSRDETPTQI